MSTFDLGNFDDLKTVMSRIAVQMRGFGNPLIRNLDEEIKIAEKLKTAAKDEYDRLNDHLTIALEFQSADRTSGSTAAMHENNANVLLTTINNQRASKGLRALARADFEYVAGFRQYADQAHAAYKSEEAEVEKIYKRREQALSENAESMAEFERVRADTEALVAEIDAQGKTGERRKRLFDNLLPRT